MDIIPFSFEGAAVRVIDRGGQPWFVLADVCRVLEVGNPSQAASRLDDDEKDISAIDTPEGRTLTTDEGQDMGRGGARSWGIISESGLYSLTLTSRKPAAKRFKKWVTAEVLPAIRKTGGYNASQPMIDVRDPSQLSRIAIQLIEMNRELQDGAKRLQAEVQAMAPDVAAYKRIANTDGLLNLTEAAKVLGQQPKAFNRWLSVNRYVYRRPGGSLLAYQDRIQSGYLEHKLVLYKKPDGSDGSRDQVMVTRRGISHFAKKLGVSLPDDLFGHSVAAE